MEGDTGAGSSTQRVAAILQGLEESGVMLTMMNRNRDQYRKDATKLPSPAAHPIILERCSVETNTDGSGLYNANSSNRGVQISDDRYTSCYRVAHCSVRPSSPPVTVSEFPPQRSTPSYFDGNFEVGGTGSCDRKESYTRSIPIRRLTTPDRRSVNRIPSRDAEAFAHSLRKYPSFPVLRSVSSEIVAKLQRSFRKHAVMSSDRSPSGELVEKVLRQTQAKFSPVANLKRPSSIRSLPRGRKTKQSRYLETSNKTEVLDNTRVDRPRAGRRDEDRYARKSARRDDSQGFLRRKSRSRTESLLNTSYDYLKALQPRSFHGRRYDRDQRIDEISRHVRSALREIYNKRSVIFPMCSKIQKRYDEHRKHCPGRSSDARMSNHQHKIASASGLYRLLELLSGYISPTCVIYGRVFLDMFDENRLSRLQNISKLYLNSEDQLYDQRNKASQCFENESGCRCRADDSDPHRVDSTCNCQPPYGEEHTRYKIEEEVHEWLAEVPVRSNEDRADKLIREDMIKDLIITLETLLYDDDFEENVINTVTECVDKMPMWNSGSKQKKEQLKDHLTQNLLDRLIPKASSKLADAIKKFLDNLNYKYEVNTKKIANDITDDIQRLKVPKTNDQYEFNLIVSEVYKALEKLPIRVNGDRTEALNALAKNLVNETIDVLREIAEYSMPNDKNNTSNARNKLPRCSLKGPCKRLELRPFYNRRKSLQYACDIDTCEYKSKNPNKSHIICDCCPKSNGNSECVCIGKIGRPGYPCDCESLEVFFNQCVDEEIEEWLNEIPVPINETEANIIKRKHASKHLAETIKQLPDTKNFKEQANDVIERWLNNISMWQPDAEQEKAKLKRLLIDSLLNRIISIPRKPDRLTVSVKKFIDSIHFDDSNVDKKELRNNLINRLKYLTVSPTDDGTFRVLLISEILESFKESLPEKMTYKTEYLHTLATKLADEIIEHEVHVDIFGDDKTSLREDFIKNLSDWVEEVAELSDTPPNMRDAKKVVDDLATKLVELHSGGKDKTTMRKMETEIQNSLKKLNICTKAMDNLIEGVMDSITDNVYTKDKTKFETAYRQEVYKDLNEWLKDKEEIANVTSQEQYSIVKEMVEKIEKANAEGQDDYQNIILGTLAEAGVYINPDLQLEKLIDKWKTFSGRHVEKALKNKIDSGVKAVLDKLDIPEDNKNYIKDKLSKELEKKITQTSISTKTGIENVNESLLEKIEEVVEELQLPKNVKDQLDEVVNANIEQVKSSRAKDVLMQTLTKEMNHTISKEDIPEIEKKHLKCKLKNMINEYSAMPFSNYVKDHILENIDRIVNEAPIESSVKERLVNKLINVADNTISELPPESIKDHVQNNILKDIDSTIEQAPIKDNVKNDLRQMLKYILQENLKQPYSAEVKDATLDQIHDTINDLQIPDVTKNDLLKKVTNIVSQDLDELPHQTEMDYAKESIMSDIDDLIDQFSLPRAQASQLKDGLIRTLTEYLDRPYSENLSDNFIEAVNKVIAETPIDFAKQEELTYKVLDTIHKRLDNITYQSPEEFAKESILKDVTRMLNETSLPNAEKSDIINKIEGIIEDCFPFDQLDIAKNVIAEGIRNVIQESSISQSEKYDLVDRMTDIAGKILDESFYDDRIRGYLHGLYGLIENEMPLHESHKHILKNELKSTIDKYLQDPELMNTLEDFEFQGQQLDETNYQEILNDIMHVIEGTSIPSNTKQSLEYKLKNLVHGTNRPKTMEQILKGVNKIIDELPIPWNEKKALKSKLSYIGPNTLKVDQLKRGLLKNIESAINIESLNEAEKRDLKNKFDEFVELLDEPISEKNEKRIKDGMLKIIDESGISREQKKHLKDRIEYLATKLSTKGLEEHGLKEKLDEYLTQVIDEAPIRQHLKKDLTAQLKRAVSDNFREPLTRETALCLKHDIVNIIDEVPITDYQRDSLKRKLNHIVLKQIEQVPMNTDDVRDLLLSDIDEILENNALPKAIKSDLLHKLKKAVLSNTDGPLSLDMKKKIQQTVSDMTDQAAISKDKKQKIKEELDNAITKNFAAVSGNIKLADDLPTVLVRNICNVIKDAPISHGNKKQLKKKIEESLPQKLKCVTSNDLEKTVNNEMLKIIDEVAASPAQKKILKNFLSNTVSYILQDTQLKALKDEIKENIQRDANIVIDRINLPKDNKKQLKYKLKDLIDEYFEKVITADSSKVMKKHVYDLVDEAPLTKEKKAEVRRNLVNIIEDHKKPLLSVPNPKQGTLLKPTKKSKRSVLHGVDSVLESLPVINEDKEYVKQMLESVAHDLPKQTPELIKDTLTIILNDSSIPRNKKPEVVDKLHDTIMNNLNAQDTSNDKTSFLHEDILQDLDPILSELQIPSADKTYLKNKFQDFIQEHMNDTISSDTMRIMKDNIHNMIAEMPLSKNQKNALSKKIFDLVKDNCIKQKQEIPVMTRKSPVYVYLSPKKKTSAISDLDSVLDRLQIPSDHKRNLKPILKNFIQETLDAPLTSNTSENIKKGISDIMIDFPINSREKKNEIKNKLFEMVDKKIKPLIESPSAVDVLMASEGTSTAMNKNIYLSPGIKNNAIREIDAVLNQLHIPSSVKIELKSVIKNAVLETLETPLSVDTAPIIKDKIRKIVVESPTIPADKKNMIKNKLNDVVESKIAPLIEAHITDGMLKDDYPHELSKSNGYGKFKNMYLSPSSKNNAIREVDAALNQLHIPSNEKNILKSDIKDAVLETFETPLSEDTAPILKEKIRNIVDESSSISPDKKDMIRKKIGDVIEYKITPLIDSHIAHASNDTLKDVYLSPTNKNNVIREIDAVLNQLHIPSSEKHELKSEIKDAVLETLETPLSVNTVPIIKDKIHNIIDESPYIGPDKKDMIIKKLSNVVEYKIAPLVDSHIVDAIGKDDQTRDLSKHSGTIKFKYQYPSERKKNMSQEIDNILDPLQISSDEKKRVKNIIGNNPHGSNIKDSIKAAVDELTLPSNKKAEVTNKLYSLVKSSSVDMSSSTCRSMAGKPSSTPNETLKKTLNSTIAHLDTSKNLKQELKEVVQKHTDQGRILSSTRIEALKNDINDVLADASISHEEKTQIENDLLNVIDENRQSLPVTPTNEKIYNVKGTVLEDIDSGISATQIPSDVNYYLKDAIKQKMEKYLETPQLTTNLEKVQEEIVEIIDEAPIAENKKAQLKIHIKNIINRNTEYLPVTGSYYNPSKTTAMRYEDRSNTKKTWPSSSKSQRDDSLTTGVIYDADDEDNKDLMSVAMSVPPKDQSAKKKKLKVNILKDFNDIVDVMNIPRNKKTDLKIKLNGITNASIDKLFSLPLKNTNETKKVIADRIEQAIEDSSAGSALNRQMKNELRDQLLTAATKNIEKTITSGNKTNGQSQMLLSTIDRLPVPGHIKDELRNKIMKSPEDSVSSSQECSRLSPTRIHGSSSILSRTIPSVIPEEEGPVTSTPKKSRRSWEKPVASFSTIANDDLMHSLSPEERDYWTQIEEAIAKWLDELPIDLDEDTKAAIKREIANDIADRVQYLQFNPGAKKSQQEELENLQYQVFRRLGKILNREEMQLAIEAGDKLMRMMKDIKEPIGDAAWDSSDRSTELELHQQIKDIISTTLPELENASMETLDSFELMKDDLADAFIKLHFTGGNDEERKQLTRKINNEIDKYCNDYLKRTPNKQLDREKIKRDLYNALKEVLPSDDEMKSVLEHVRLKDVVHEWTKKLPLKRLTNAERIEMNKDIALLAKKLLDLEQNDELSDGEIRSKMAAEIEQFLMKAPLKPGQEKNFNKFANDLIDRLNKTKSARTFNSSTRHSVTIDEFLGDSVNWPMYPPCTLSAEDLEHLERIRKRACMAPDCLATLIKNAAENQRNASVSPMSIDTGAQTVDHPDNTFGQTRMPPYSPMYGSKQLPPEQFCNMPYPGSPFTQSLSHMDVQPQIIIKEYYWNSTNTCELPKSDSRLSGGVPKRTCFVSRPPRCQQKYSQTCQDKALGSIPCIPSPCVPSLCTPNPCTPSPCTPKFYTPRHVNSNGQPQFYIPCQRINLQNSFTENNGSKRDNPYTENTESHLVKTRNERVIELGSLDELRKPCQNERRFGDVASSSRTQKQIWEERQSSPDDSDEVEVLNNRGQAKERPVICKCKPKPAPTGLRARWRQETPKDRAVLASDDSASMKRCLKCCGMHCPYPSFMYFKH